MGVRVEWVRYGRDAAGALRSSISRAKGAEPLAPVAVVVPSNHVGVAARRLLGSGAVGPVSGAGVGLAAVTFLTPYRMAELLGAARLAGGGRRPVSTPVVTSAIRAALTERPGVFAPVAAHAATETALVSAYRELRDLSADALDSLARGSSRAADVVRLHRSARARLESEWYDEQDLVGAAVETLAAGGGAARELGAVIVYLPQRLSRHGAQLLGAFAATSEVVVLAGTTGDPRADGEVVRSVGRLGGGAAAGERPADIDPMDVVGADRTTIVTTSDGDEEVRVAVRAVVDAVRAGTRLDRIAVLHASPEPYARLAHEQLAAAGIAHNGAAVMPLTARMAGRTLLQLLALPGGGFRRDDVFAWLAGAELQRRGRSIPVGAWERISRDAGVVAGREQWDRLLAGFATEVDERAARAEGDPDAPPSRAEHLRAEARRAGELRTFVLGLVDDLAEAAAHPRPWGDRARWARRRLDDLLGTGGRRDRWPEPERKAAERIERAIDRLACLDSVEGPVGLDVFTRTLELEMEADLGRVGRIGEGVLVGPVSMGVGLDLDLVVVLGLAEGLFPADARDDSLLPDHERQAAGDELPLRSQRIEREHHELLAALGGASRHLLCVPRGDLRRSSERVPSRWVLQLASAIAGGRWWSADLLGTERPWLRHVASFDAGLRQLSFPASSQEHRLRSLMAHGPASPVGAAPTIVGDAVLGAGVEALAARGSSRFTRFDGNLGGLSVPSPTDRVTSATRLETWADCPFAYLMHDLLGVEEVENPEDQLQISPRDRGSLVHEVLERFIAEVLARPPAARPGPQDRWSASDRSRLVELGEEVCAAYEARGLTGRALFWERERRHIIADLEHFLRADDAHRAAERTRPIAAELAFGLPGAALGTVDLPIPDGRTVRFRGKADRVDLAADSSLHVVDYKTGGANGYKGLSEDDPDLAGRKLQLAVYGAAARLLYGSPDVAVRAEYWFTSAKGRFERVGYSVTPEVLERVGRTVGAMVAGIESGAFPNHPTAASTTPWVECPFCDPDGLGVVDLRGRFDRKRSDPAMAPFIQLASPMADVDLDAAVDDDADAGPDTGAPGA